jgi:osomolarity two-component system sensor histidine kinase NIK1
MGGTLEVSSTFGEGSDFTFDLPLGRSHTGYDEVFDLMKPFWGRSILYLDSEHDTTGVAEMIRNIGLKVFVAHTLETAFKISEEEKIDTVVLDSIDLVRPLRSHVRLSSVSIILTTSGTIKDLNKSLAEPSISCIYTTPTSAVDLSPPLMAALLLDHATPLDGIACDVLLVEDNRINRNIVVKMLKGSHRRVDSVENGQEAFNAFVANRYDVILMVCFIWSFSDEEGRSNACNGWI